MNFRKGFLVLGVMASSLSIADETSQQFVNQALKTKLTQELQQLSLTKAELEYAKSMQVRQKNRPEYQALENKAQEVLSATRKCIEQNGSSDKELEAIIAQTDSRLFALHAIRTGKMLLFEACEECLLDEARAVHLCLKIQSAVMLFHGVDIAEKMGPDLIAIGELAQEKKMQTNDFESLLRDFGQHRR